MDSSFLTTHQKTKNTFRKVRKLLSFALKIPFLNKKLINSLIDISQDIISTANTISESKNYYDFKSYKRKSEKLYILGSGSSVNSIISEEWAEIKKHDCFSFNYFLVSGFVGDLHFIESSEIDEEQGIYYKAILEDENLKKTPYIINQLHFSDSVLKPDPAIEHLFYFQNPYRFPSFDKRIIKGLLKYGHFLIPIHDPNFGIHHSSSVCYLINLGVRMGFKHIVLVGIDLNNTDYFFYSLRNTLAEKITGIYKNIFIHQKIHRTANNIITSSYKSMSTPEFIKLYDKVVCKKENVVLQVANPKSLLSEFLSVYNFGKL
jgi:hypothetical protein